MRCTHCGARIPDEMLHCPECGMEVQIVPDYNPLEDVLAQEVKGSIEDATRQIRTDDIRRYRREGSREYSNSTRVLSQGELDEIRAKRSAVMRQNRQSGRGTQGTARQMRPDTGSMRQSRQNTNSRITDEDIREQDEYRRRIEADEKRRQQIARKKRLAKKRRQRALIIMLLLVIAAGGIGILYYQNSYNGQIRKGNQALSANDYTLAENYFNKAISKDNKKPEAYTGLSNVFIQQDDLEGAEAVFLTAISSQPSNVDLYQAAIDFYVDTKQLIKVSELLADCEYDEVLEGVQDFVSVEPEFSLEEGTFEEVQQVSLSSDSGTIYYTTDGSEPDTSSEKYDTPILLNKEGTIVVKAISVNKKKIPSLTATKNYVIELPMEDAPSVTPSTGQYDTATQITITVPEGYTAYYTLDDTDPSDPAVNATEYTGPIDMPEGQTMFSAVLRNNNTEKYTPVTKRNYVLDISE